MIHLSTSTYDRKFVESALNAEIDKVMQKIFGGIFVDISCIRSLKLQATGQLTVWSDQRRIGKVFLFRAQEGKLFASIRFRLEFIRTINLFEVLETIAFQIRSRYLTTQTESIFLLYRDLSQGDGNQFLPSIPGITWFCLR
jgi:hypothetical protein